MRRLDTESIKPFQVSSVQKKKKIRFLIESRVTLCTHFYLPRTNIYCAISFAVFVHQPLCNCLLLPGKLQEITKYNFLTTKIRGKNPRSSNRMTIVLYDARVTRYSNTMRELGNVGHELKCSIFCSSRI